MKKQSLMKLAMLGVSMALLTNGCRNAEGEDRSDKMRTFYEQLSPDAQQKFNALDEEHKKKALEIVDQYCSGKSECSGHREQAVEEQYNRQMQERKNLEK